MINLIFWWFIMPTKYKNNITVATLYKFVEINDLQSLRSEIQALCKENNAKGTILLAKEGINGMLAGDNDSINQVIDFIVNNFNIDFSEIKISYTRVLVQ